jgi:hypothetical protein
MKLTSVLAGLVALFVSMTLLMYVVSPSTINATLPRGPAEDAARDKNEPVDGKYEFNPFEFGEQGPFPRVQLDETEYKFGQMPVGDIGKHTFLIKNVGEAPLKLARGSSTCKCTVGTLGQDEVAPGDSAEVEMEWHPPGQSMEFTQSATVWTNDPQQREIKLTILGQVVPHVISYPEGAWTVTVSENAPTQFKGMILAMLQDSFEITGIETSQPWISVTPRPFTADEAQREMGKSGYELNCEIQPVMPVGAFKERVTVKTTIKNHEEFQFEISGTRAGPFNVVGPGWISSLQVLRMGRVPSDAGKVVKLSLFSAERDPPLEVAVESIDPPVLNATVDRKMLDEAAARLQFIVNLEVPRGAVPARYSDDHLIHVRLKTNHPEAEAVSFDVELQVD